MVQVLSTAIATRVCYAYGFDAKDPDVHHIVTAMVNRSFLQQSGKVQAGRVVNQAGIAAKDRVRWSVKLREDHRILEALERLMKHWNGGNQVPVAKVAKGLPAVAIVMGSATNSYGLGDVAKRATMYAQTCISPRSTGSRFRRSCARQNFDARRGGGFEPGQPWPGDTWQQESRCPRRPLQSDPHPAWTRCEPVLRLPTRAADTYSARRSARWLRGRSVGRGGRP